MASELNMIKLCVGAEVVEDLIDWQRTVAARNLAEGREARATHVTRMWPRRADEVLDGGSIYWVFKGLVLCRQRIVAFEPREGADGIRRCAIGLDPDVVRTLPQPRRPFQGWRYLRRDDAPGDLRSGSGGLPPGLMAELAEIGVI